MIVHNPTDTAVNNYPIQDPKSGDVALWSIQPGETLDFPDYVGKYLTDVYAFLQRVITQEQLDAEKAEQERLDKGKHFEPVKVVGGGLTNEMVQPPAPTPEQLKPANPTLTPPALQPDMAGKIEGDDADKVQPAQPTTVPEAPTPAPKKEGGLICPECGNHFQNKAALKTHYAHQHLTLPGID